MAESSASSVILNKLWLVGHKLKWSRKFPLLFTGCLCPITRKPLTGVRSTELSLVHGKSWVDSVMQRQIILSLRSAVGHDATGFLYSSATSQQQIFKSF